MVNANFRSNVGGTRSHLHCPQHEHNVCVYGMVHLYACIASAQHMSSSQMSLATIPSSSQICPLHTQQCLVLSLHMKSSQSQPSVPLRCLSNPPYLSNPRYPIIPVHSMLSPTLDKPLGVGVPKVHIPRHHMLYDWPRWAHKCQVHCLVYCCCPCSSSRCCCECVAYLLLLSNARTRGCVWVVCDCTSSHQCAQHANHPPHTQVVPMRSPHKPANLSPPPPLRNHLQDHHQLRGLLRWWWEQEFR